MYSEGEGVPLNKAEAAKWYRLLAERGNVGAQALLGLMYQDGEGVPQNYAEAAKWYRLAAEQGEAGAQICLPGCTAGARALRKALPKRRSGTALLLSKVTTMPKLCSV